MSIEDLIDGFIKEYEATGPMGVPSYIGTLNKDEIILLREYVKNMSLDEDMNHEKVREALLCLRAFLIGIKDMHMSGSKVRR